jgi:hypothetical protein
VATTTLSTKTFLQPPDTCENIRTCRVLANETVFLSLAKVANGANSKEEIHVKKLFVATLLIACTALGVARANAGGYYVSMGAPGGKQITYINSTSNQPDVRMPGTQYRGVRYYQQPRRGGYYPIQGVPHRYGQQRHYSAHHMERYGYRQSSVQSAAPAKRPNPIKEKYLADCAANGAPVTQTAGGGMNCYRSPRVTTIID